MTTCYRNCTGIVEMAVVGWMENGGRCQGILVQCHACLACVADVMGCYLVCWE